MSKLIGTNPNQVPSNADLGTAAFMDKKEFLLSKGSEMSAINTVIPKTAVDVFIYDTSKDSDGGAWRKRVQHTSWYNERLNTTTRGSRKDFPAVAVIVLSANDITIYDGDDPEMPMWMIFWRYENGASSGNTTHWNGGGGILTSISALNGHIVLGGYSGGRGFYLIKDKFAVYYTAAGGLYTQGGGLSRRNELYVAWGNADSDYKQINNQSINDVAITVLPNAPIDADTGLPVPTFALATNGGVSVIKDDGTVVDITVNNASYTYARRVNFLSDNSLGMGIGVSNGVAQESYYIFNNIPTSDNVITVDNIAGTTQNVDEFYAIQTPNSLVDLQLLGLDTNRALLSSTGNSFASNEGLSVISRNVGAPDKGLISYIASDYNTGWMVGAIKLATLSDTDTTNAGAEIVTNGNFATNSDWSLGAGWSISGGKATHDSTTGNRYLTQGGILEEGKQYVLVFTISDYTSGTLRIYGSTTQPIDITEAVGTFTIPFIAASGGDVNFQSSVSAAFVGSISNVSCKLAEQDRSVNGNGLQVLGTVTKTPVATGAELVAYSGFTSSNYLQQPYNADLNFGTGDFSFSGWFYSTSVTSQGLFSRVAEGLGGSQAGFAMNTAGSGALGWAIYTTGLHSSGRTNCGFGFTPAVNVWNHVVAMRKSGIMYMYLNGVLDTNLVPANTNNITDTSNSPALKVGILANGGSPATATKMALWRISATAPTEEQIKKIYNDEKFLFQENAKATLYGTSDAVTALAYDDDTELLHVGTSAGRSDLQGLRRINNTTRAIGTAISAVDGFIVEE